MIKNVDISVVIVNYNVKDYLLQCLRSIEKAKCNYNVEIIVVDNNSADGSVTFLKPLFPDVQFIELEQNIGFGRANNIGIKKSSGKYILILNPDTIIDDNTLHVMYAYMESHQEVGISGCKVLNPDGSFQYACRRGFPTPWASFCKLFGLQSLFPKSEIFAKYNQTFRSVDETYYIDSVIGAFMFVRKEVFEHIKGFDADFFMYGEDLDLCYRANKVGWKTAYVHETSIIHYKGESTKRSSINEVKHFYEAMEIFVSKHYSASTIFLLFLKFGILMRSVLAYFFKNFQTFLFILIDIILINSSLLLATKIRFGEFFNFPDYAYPTVFLVITFIMFASMISVGEYFEGKPAIRKSFFGFMISFFILSSLTYFFKEYAFSRGILLMTIGFTIILASISRGLFSLFVRMKGKESGKRIAVLGTNIQAENICKEIQNSEAMNADIVGIINSKPFHENKLYGLPVIGSIDYLPKIIEEYKIREIIITEPEISPNALIKLTTNSSFSNVRFHIAQEYEELIAARLINDITGIEPTVPQYNITKLRFKISKRIADFLISIVSLTIGLPFILLFLNNKKLIIKKLWLVLIGNYSYIGLYYIDNLKPEVGKVGVISLADVSNPDRLTPQAVEKLNQYYNRHFNLSLDLDIFFKYIFRKKSGN